MLPSQWRRGNGGRHRHSLALLLSLSPGFPPGQRFASGRETITWRTTVGSIGAGPRGVLHGKGAKQVAVRADPHARELIESITLIEQVIGMVAESKCSRPSRCRFRWRTVGRDNAGFDGHGWRRVFVRPDGCYRGFPPVLLREQPGRLVLALIQSDRGPLQLPVDR
jgi:hypothetical protein